MRCIKIAHWIFIRNFRVDSTTCFTTTQEGRGTWISFLHFSFSYEKYCYDLELYLYPEIKYHEMCATSGYDKVDEFLKLSHFTCVRHCNAMTYWDVRGVQWWDQQVPQFCVLNSPVTTGIKSVEHSGKAKTSVFNIYSGHWGSGHSVSISHEKTG